MVKPGFIKRKSKVKSKEILSTPKTNPSHQKIPNKSQSKLATLQEQSDKMSQARTRISIRGEGVLQVEHRAFISSPPLDHWLHQDGTRYSRQLSVVETLETGGTTKETSEETIKIGEEQVSFFPLNRSVKIGWRRRCLQLYSTVAGGGQRREDRRRQCQRGGSGGVSPRSDSPNCWA